MKENAPIIIIVAIILSALIIFLIYRNKKDRKNLENKLNNDYPKPTRHADEHDPGDVLGQ